MLAILTTHPIQYQVPIWQALAKENKIPFEVWYLTDHGTQKTYDEQFGKTFSWDLNTLEGYPYRFVKVNKDASVNVFKKLKLEEDLVKLFKEKGVTHLWIQGWQVFAYWQAVWQAKRAGVKVMIRAESNDLAQRSFLKQVIKYIPMKFFFNAISHFLYIGEANKRFYKSYGVKEFQLLPAPYCVDNDRFSKQADGFRSSRNEIRQGWKINENDFCILFCGKFIPKKNPMHIVKAVEKLSAQKNIHILFVGSGELEQELKSTTNMVYPSNNAQGDLPKASFVGFLNQSEIAKAYVAADVMILPSNYNETWGLVANEAMAAGLPCIVSDQCGCAEDLVKPLDKNLVFACGDIDALASSINYIMHHKPEEESVRQQISRFHLNKTIESVDKIILN